MAIRKKDIKDRAKKYNKALFEGAKDVEFKGYKQADLATEITGLESLEDTRASLAAQIKLVDEQIDNKYIKIDDMCVDIRSGVEGHKDYGNDSPLWGAMGQIRKSERKSGLTRGKKNG